MVKQMLSIIIVNYKSSNDISFCIESIIKFEKRYNDYEIIIVDNNSDDLGLKLLNEQYPFLKIINADKNGGFAYGNNIGINYSNGDYVLLLNPDTFIVDNSIEKLLNRIKTEESIGIIGPLILFPDGRNQSFYLPKSYLNIWRLFCERFYLYRIFKNVPILNSYYRTYMDYSKETFVDQVSGAALLFRKSIIEKIGLLDENYFMYFEESDFCLQAVRNNIKQLYYPKSKIVHKGGLDLESGWSNTSSWYIDSLMYYFKKNFGSISYYTALILFSIGAFLKSGLFFIKNDHRYKFHFMQFKKLLKSL